MVKAVLLYRSGLSLKAIAYLTSVVPSTVLRRVRRWADELGREVAITATRAQDLDASSPATAGQGRFFVAQGPWGAQRDFGFADNVTRDLAVHTVLYRNRFDGKADMATASTTSSTATPSTTCAAS